MLQFVQRHEAGACNLFLGTTRQFTAGKETIRLEYECYRPMAEKKLHQLRHQAMERWGLVECAIVHRVGLVPVGEGSVAIAVSSLHRADSLAASEWLIDTLKQEVPIWKKENFSDGSQEWIHPEKQSS